MEIDRLRDDDPPLAAADAAPDDLATAGVDEQSAAEPDSRGPGDRAAIHAGYQAKAEAAYLDAAREHWETAAKPAFEREWLRYAQTHPADWRSSASIDEAAATSVRRGCADIRETEEKVVTPAMLRIEAEDPDRHLIGLEFRRKGEDRIMEKVARQLEAQPDLTPADALTTVKDAIRYTYQYTEEHYAEGVYADIGRLQTAGFELIELRNSWSGEEYKGINSRWRVPENGQLFEVQFHTKISFEAKQLTHPAYERLRNPATTNAERDELEDFQRRVNAYIPIPPHAQAIPEHL
ncbi:MAG TPA: hypothetical protein VKV38_04170 [Trebonia sp.]|nr:hypothetical protein [Trebonia sp.]